MSQPLVSVVIPNYNYGHFIGKTIQSVIDQSYQNWEMIIVDDSSTDNSAEIVRSFQASYPERKISFIQLEGGPSGTSRPINEGIRRMKGKYFAWLSSDEYFHPDKLKIQVEEMEQDPEVMMCFSLGKAHDQEGEVLNSQDRLFFGGGELDVVQYFQGSLTYPNISRALFRRSCLETHGFFRENDAAYHDRYPEIWRASDTEYILEVWRTSRVKLLPFFLGISHWHIHNKSLQERVSEMTELVKYRFVEKYDYEEMFIREIKKKKVLTKADKLKYFYLLAEMSLAASHEKVYLRNHERIKERHPEGVMPLLAAFFQIRPSFSNETQKRLMKEACETFSRELLRKYHPAYSLGSLLKTENDLVQAKQYFLNIIDLPEIYSTQLIAKACFHVGEILYQQKQNEAAFSYFEKCHHLWPEHQKAKEAMLVCVD